MVDTDPETNPDPETASSLSPHFHRLVVPVGLACLWIPACAGMTMKAKTTGMGDS
jgi:hypothetical protein